MALNRSPELHRNINVMMVRDSHCLIKIYPCTYQISLTYLERQTRSFFPLLDLGVKGQGQMNVMMVRNTPSNGDAPTYQISLQTSYGPDKILLLFDLGVKGI